MARDRLEVGRNESGDGLEVGEDGWRWVKEGRDGWRWVRGGQK